MKRFPNPKLSVPKQSEYSFHGVISQLQERDDANTYGVQVCIILCDTKILSRFSDFQTFCDAGPLEQSSMPLCWPGSGDRPVLNMCRRQIKDTSGKIERMSKCLEV